MKHCEDCIHDEVCGMWAVDTGYPFVNADTCVHYKAKNDVAEVVHCLDCEHLMFSDMYGECRKAHLGIVSPRDFCSRGQRERKE